MFGFGKVGNYLLSHACSPAGFAVGMMCQWVVGRILEGAATRRPRNLATLTFPQPPLPSPQSVPPPLSSPPSGAAPPSPQRYS